jgi:hypothetical protein
LEAKGGSNGVSIETLAKRRQQRQVSERQPAKTGKILGFEWVQTDFRLIEGARFQPSILTRNFSPVPADRFKLELELTLRADCGLKREVGAMLFQV